MSEVKATFDGVPIFTVEHDVSDCRYVKLKLTSEYREIKPHFKEIQYLDRLYLLDTFTFVDEAAILENHQGEMHGPAYKHGPICKDVGNFKHYNNSEIDSTSVFKYPGNGWPDTCEKWFNRERKYDWPSPELVETIKSKGCHIAPVGREYAKHAKAPTDPLFMLNPIEIDLEWRLSFSVAETALGQSLPPTLRYVFVLLKILKKVYFPADIITTYHLKQLIYWKCESQPVSSWREDQCVLYVIDLLNRLTECAKKRFLPHYILSSSNALSDTDDKQLEELVISLENISTNIFEYLQNALKRVQSLAWMSRLYQRNIVFEPDTLTQQIQEPNSNPIETIEAILKVFLEANFKLRKHIKLDVDKTFDDNRPLMNVLLLVYEIQAAKTLYHLWCRKNGGDGASDSVLFDKSEFDKFCQSFLQQHGVSDSEFSDEFSETLDIFFAVGLSGGSLMSAYETSSLMQLLKEKCFEISEESSQSAQKKLDYKSPNMQETLEDRVHALYLEKGGIITEEDIKNLGESFAKEILGFPSQDANVQRTKVQTNIQFTQTDLESALKIIEGGSSSS